MSRVPFDPAPAPEPHSAGRGARAADPADSDPNPSTSHADAPTVVSDSSARLASGDSAPSAGTLIDNNLISGYTLLEEIHRGGQGVVYRALQLGTKRTVALKVLLEGPFAGDASRRRFEREVELAASLRHPSIVTILDSGVSYGRYYFAMEYIEGLRLDRYLAQNRPSFGATLTLLAKVCDAVNFAHQRGVIHRDLKPPNILVDESGEPHVLDFGLAKPIQGVDGREDTVQMLSMTGQILGTVAYMSPEQCSSSGDVDVRSDVYSLGVLFYEALLSQPPYPVEGALAEVLNRIMHQEPASPRQVRTGSRFGRLIGDEIETILLKALDKSPARRYQTAADLGRDLRHLLDGTPIEAKRASGLYMLKKTLRRYKLQAGAAGIILAMLLAFLIVFAVLYRKERDSRLTADLLRTQISQRLEETQAAEARERDAREQAERSADQAHAARRELQQALTRQKIQRGDLALARGDLVDARDSYFDALEDGGAAARWALRTYYLQTPDHGASVVEMLRYGPTAVAPAGSEAAVCCAPDAIGVVQFVDGRMSAWVRTPGPVTALRINDDEVIAAAGPGWARLWEKERVRPAIAVSLPDGFTPIDAFELPSPRTLVVVGADRAYSFVSDNPGAASQIALNGVLPRGTADLSVRLRLIAVPTADGVQLLSVDAGGQLSAELAWSTERGPARSVRFDRDELLAVLGDSVWLAGIAEPEPRARVRQVEDARGWDMFDLANGIRRMVFASHDGRVALFRSGRLVDRWQLTLGALNDVRLSIDESGFYTLDDRGTLSEWSTRREREQLRRVLPTPVEQWAATRDGARALLADARGRVVTYAYGDETAARLVQAPGFLSLSGLADDLALALSGDARIGAIATGDRVRLLDMQTGSDRFVPWTNLQTPSLRNVALDERGRLVAYVARGRAGERQRLGFWRLEPEEFQRRGLQRRSLLPDVGAPYEFVGAEIRAVEFVPAQERLLVARSNGDLLLIEPSTTAAEPPDPILTLEAAPSRVAFDRSGGRIAVACEDNVVRLVTLAPEPSVLRIAAGGVPVSIAFNAADDVLLLRNADGKLSLFETRTGERIVQRAIPARGARPLALWAGDGDALVYEDDGVIVEQRNDLTDAMIERNRSFGGQRQVARRLSDDDIPGAWNAAVALRSRNDAAGRAAQAAVLDAALRRRTRRVDLDAWSSAVLDGAVGATYLRIGHAAYDGEYFERARRWLQTAQRLSPDGLDAFSMRRIAECDYLLGEYAAAAAEFANAVDRADLDIRELPTILLERVAALVMAGRRDEARPLALRIGEVIPNEPTDQVATASARVAARFVAGIESESLMAAGLDSLLTTFAERSLLFRDDVYFYAGELARQRGDLHEAEMQYQRCIDISNDRWPANWSRYRLLELAPRRAEHTEERL